jgi:site-specific recombinase XerD
MSRSIDGYLAYIEAIRSLSPQTVSSYRKDLALFEASCVRSGIAIEDADAAEIRGFVAGLVKAKYAPASVNRALSAVKGLYRYMARYGDTKGKANPAGEIEGLPNPRGLPSFMFEAEMDEFIGLASGDGFAGSRDRALFETLYSTGCRVSELAGLQASLVDLQERRAKVRGKGGKERIVYLSEPAVEAIRNWLPYRSARIKAERPQGHLFINARGGALTTRGIAYIIEGYVRKSGTGRGLSPHGFRHSFATHLLAGGADIRIVQELLGHENISTTQIYTHVDVDRLRAVYRSAHPHAALKRATGATEATT